MILSSIFATVLRLFGPELDEVHEQVAAELPVRPECDAPIFSQPYDCPDRVRWALVAIADRESPGNYSARKRWVGRHRGDSRLDARLWTAGWRRADKGYKKAALSWWCPAHLSPEGLSTVGPHGLIYLYNVHRLDAVGNCLPWWLFASPEQSARAARHRYLQLCDDAGPARGWCPSLRAAMSARKRRCDRRELPRDECSRELLEE